MCPTTVIDYLPTGIYIYNAIRHQRRKQLRNIEEKERENKQISYSQHSQHNRKDIGLHLTDEQFTKAVSKRETFPHKIVQSFVSNVLNRLTAYTRQLFHVILCFRGKYPEVL